MSEYGFSAAGIGHLLHDAGHWLESHINNAVTKSVDGALAVATRAQNAHANALEHFGAKEAADDVRSKIFTPPHEEQYGMVLPLNIQKVYDANVRDSRCAQLSQVFSVKCLEPQLPALSTR